MNWVTIGLLLAVITAAIIINIRTVPGGRRAFAILWLLLALLIYRWANYRGAWTELWIALGGSFLLLTAWWLLFGRHLPSPSDDNIRVWSEEEPFE